MVLVRRGHADRAIEIRQRVVERLRLGFFYAALDFADGVEVFVHLRAIACAELPLQAGDVFAHPVEQAGAAAERLAPIRGAAAFAEQALEHHARMRLRRQGCRRRRPGQIVLVDAGIAVVALADHFHQVHGELERRELGFLPHLLSGDLIDRGAEIVVAAFGPLRLRRAEERRVRGGVGAGICVPELRVAEHSDVALQRFERAERARQIGECAGFSGRRPARDVRSHRDVDEPEAADRFCRRLRQRRHRRDHRVQQRQCDCRAHASQECPPGKGLLRNDHDVFLINWLGAPPGQSRRPVPRCFSCETADC